jgi:hypothetical protein
MELDMLRRIPSHIAVWFLALLFSWAVLAPGSAALAKAPAKSKGRPAAKKKQPEKKPEPEPPPMRKPVVTKVDPAKRAEAIASAARIDELVERNWARHHVTPNAMTNDEQFVRRAFLDIVGVIPNYKQARGYLNQKDNERRYRLIDFLLGTDGYASHNYNYWGDVLRLRDDRLVNAVPAAAFNEWVRKAFETNKPYDEWVYEMLSAEGRAYDNPATGYLVRDSNMPLDGVSNTLRVFTGTQIGCAQCHDHPFDRWTQKEFYEMAAYTYGTVYRRPLAEMFGTKEAEKKYRDSVKDYMLTFDKKYDFGVIRPVFEANYVEVLDRGRQLRLPKDYQYTNAKANDIVPPRAIFGPSAPVGKNESPRAAFAKWLTSPQNTRFATTIANRMWKRLFGVGLIEPLDDMKDDTVAENPELMEYLTQEMLRLEFDLKEFQRILMYTKTYNREATHQEVVAGQQDYHFPGPILRRMTAEQVWDSFITLAAFDDPGEYHREDAATVLDMVNLDLTKTKPEELIETYNKYRDHTAYKAQRKRTKKYEYKGLVLVRASELSTPLPLGHFIRQFGQSDREQIQGSNTDGSVPQALQMFNGPITHMLLEPDSMMYKNVTAENKIEDRVDVIFLSVLNRRATASDRKIALNEIKNHGNAGYGNVIWALVNTPEFLFIQ